MNENPIELSNTESFLDPVTIDFYPHYDQDQLFSPIKKALEGEFPDDKLERNRLMRIIHLFKMREKVIFYRNKACVPRTCVRDILY